MAYSYQTYVANGTATDYQFDFPYLDRAHIKVLVNNATVPFSFLNDSTVRLAAPAVAAATIVVRRVTPVDEAPVDYNDGSVLREDDLDRAVLYNLYVVQELYDLLNADINLGDSDAELLNNAAFNYDIALQVPYAPDNGEKLMNLIMTTDVRLPVNAAGSTAYVDIPAFGVPAVFSVRKNGASVGTITFAPGSQIGSFQFATPIVWAVGDRLDIVAPSPVPVNFKGMGVILRTRRIAVV